jgi:hypothetical protein
MYEGQRHSAVMEVHGGRHRLAYDGNFSTMGWCQLGNS